MKTNSSIFPKVLQGGKMTKYGYIALLLIVGVTMAATQTAKAGTHLSAKAKIEMTTAAPENAASVTTDCTTVAIAITKEANWTSTTTGQSQEEAVTEITTTAKKAMTMDVTKPDKANCLRNENLSDVNCTINLVTVEASPQAVTATSDVFDISTPAATAKTELIFQYNLIGVAMTKMAPVKMAGKVDFLKEGNEDAVMFSSSTTG